MQPLVSGKKTWKTRGIVIGALNLLLQLLISAMQIAGTILNKIGVLMAVGK